jgi:hypothetical protein
MIVACVLACVIRRIEIEEIEGLEVGDQTRRVGANRAASVPGNDVGASNLE